MIKILISCGAGMSSSFLCQKLQKACEEAGLENEYSFDFFPINVAGYEAGAKKIEEYDVTMICPHLRLWIKELVEKQHPNKPIYVLPPQMYGTMIFEEVITEAKDIISGFEQTKMNPYHFPGEEQVLKIRRKCAYRNK